MATTLSSTFRLASLTGTDPVSINIAPTLSIGDPSGSGSLTTYSAGNVLITDGSSNTIGLLKPQDFLFLPLKALTGCRVLYDTTVTTVDWFYWTRSK